MSEVIPIEDITECIIQLNILDFFSKKWTLKWTKIIHG